MSADRDTGPAADDRPEPRDGADDGTDASIDRSADEEPRAEAWTDVLGVGDEEAEGPGPKIFQHPEWTVGLVLVFAVVSLLLALANPLFLIIGSPFILVLGLWIGVRLYERLRVGAGEETPPEGP